MAPERCSGAILLPRRLPGHHLGQMQKEGLRKETLFSIWSG
jgi:hypothetical protein